MCYPCLWSGPLTHPLPAGEEPHVAALKQNRIARVRAKRREMCESGFRTGELEWKALCYDAMPAGLVERGLHDPRGQLILEPNTV